VAEYIGSAAKIHIADEQGTGVMPCWRRLIDGQQLILPYIAAVDVGVLLLFLYFYVN